MKHKCIPLQCNTVVFPVTVAINITDVLELFIAEKQCKAYTHCRWCSLSFCAGGVNSSFKEEETEAQ